MLDWPVGAAPHDPWAPCQWTRRHARGPAARQGHDLRATGLCTPL